MIVDSSAIIAVLRNEPDADRFSVLLASVACSISAATLLETSIVAGPRLQTALDRLLASTGITVAPFDAAQAQVARDAYQAYGKGSGSRAHLNLGDCFSYALAKTTGRPLVFKGDGFAHTDVVSALDQEPLGD